MLKAVDGYFEKRISGGRLDFCISPDLRKDCMEFLDDKEIDVIKTQMRQRSNMAVTSNYLALACPFAPIALLNAFFALNKLDTTFGRQLLSVELLQSRHAEAIKAAAVLADMQKGRTKDHAINDKRFNALLDKNVNTRPRKPKDKQVLFKSQSMEGVNRSMLDRSILNKQKKQLQIGKIVKAKTFLQAQLDQYNKRQDVIGANRVSNKLSALEKNLKLLGC